jgi:hypothetical protein
MKLKSLTLAISVAYLMLSCNEKGLFEPAVFEKAELIYAYGDTTKSNWKANHSEIKKKDINNAIFENLVVHDTMALFKGIKLHGAPANAVDVSKLKNTKEQSRKNKDFEYIAIGGTLASGFRDGGLYNEGILTSYPALLARQMKVVKFNSPVFDAQDFNGIGRKIKTNFNPTKGPIAKYALVTNNTAIEGYDEQKKQPNLKKSKYNWLDMHNMAIPFMDYEKSIGTYESESFKVHKNRYLSDFSVYDDLVNKSADFFTIEGSGFEVGTYLDFRKQFNIEHFYQKFMREAAEKGMKGVVILKPEIENLPIYFQIPCGLIEKNSNNILKAECTNNGYVFGRGSYLDSIASPIVNINLKTRNFHSGQTNDGGKTFNIGLSSGWTVNTQLEYSNKLRKDLAVSYGYPVFELDKMFIRIMEGSFVTDDGTKIDPTFGKGNFFSSDGMYPTAFGHAVIANELIKVINNHYKTNIPLIPTREY